MEIRVVLLSLAILSCILPIKATPTAGLAQAAYDIAAAKGAAVVAAKTALVKGAASLAVQGAAIGSSVILGAIAGGLNATAEAFKPANEDPQHHESGVLDKFARVIELKKQLVHNLLEGEPEKPDKIIPLEATPLYFNPVVVQDVVQMPPQPVVLSQDMSVVEVECDDQLQLAPVPVKVLPPHLFEYRYPPQFPMRRLLTRGRYPLPLVRNFRLH